MKLAVLSESSADEAAIRILVDALLGMRTVSSAGPRFEARNGYHSVVDVLPALIKSLHFNSDADGLVIVVDSNGSPVHHEVHGAMNEPPKDCRLCHLRFISRTVRAQLRPRAHAPPLQLAFGLACPAVEAWYRCGVDPHATEVAWIRDFDAGSQAPLRIRELKKVTYGTDKPSLPVETKVAETECRRLAANLETLIRDFPAGFGALANDVRSWSLPPLQSAK